MSKTFTDVQMFMLASGQSLNTNNEEQSQLYHRLINEEYNEFIVARNQKDDVETLNGSGTCCFFNCFLLLWIFSFSFFQHFFSNKVFCQTKPEISPDGDISETKFVRELFFDAASKYLTKSSDSSLNSISLSLRT